MTAVSSHNLKSTFGDQSSGRTSESLSMMEEENVFGHGASGFTQ